MLALYVKIPTMQCPQLFVTKDPQYFSGSQIFRSMLKSNHCLHELLSCYAQRSDSLRSRGHDYVLPACISNLHK